MASDRATLQGVLAELAEMEMNLAKCGNDHRILTVLMGIYRCEGLVIQLFYPDLREYVAGATPDAVDEATAEAETWD